MARDPHILLAQVSARVAGLVSPRFRRELGQVLGAATLKLVDDGFRAGRDPYGKAWPKPKFRQGKPMIDTGRARGSFSAQPRADGFSVGSNAHYLRTHQAEPFTIRPVRAAVLAFPARGRPTKRNLRGPMRMIFARSVRTVQRLVMPLAERGLPDKWAGRLNREAEAFVRAWLK